MSFNVFSIAFLAAVGNAIYVYGIRTATPPSNPLIFPLCSMLVASCILAACIPFFDTGTLRSDITNNISNILISAVGSAAIYIMFYFLYSRFGAIHYGLYAVLSIITTSLVVGVLVLKEPLSHLQILALILGAGAIALFNYGKS